MKKEKGLLQNQDTKMFLDPKIPISEFAAGSRISNKPKLPNYQEIQDSPQKQKNKATLNY